MAVPPQPLTATSAAATAGPAPSARMVGTQCTWLYFGPAAVPHDAGLGLSEQVVQPGKSRTPTARLRPNPHATQTHGSLATPKRSHCGAERRCPHYGWLQTLLRDSLLRGSADRVVQWAFRLPAESAGLWSDSDGRA